ncbi:hypothetical protein V6Z12_A13G268600 [Gossypium hirsutum]
MTAELWALRDGLYPRPSAVVGWSMFSERAIVVQTRWHAKAATQLFSKIYSLGTNRLPLLHLLWTS